MPQQEEGEDRVPAESESSLGRLGGAVVKCLALGFSSAQACEVEPRGGLCAEWGGGLLEHSSPLPLPPLTLPVSLK